MKYRIIQSLLLAGMMVSLSASSFKENVPCNYNLSTEIETEDTEMSVVTREETLVEIATNQMNRELEKLNSISDKKEWFLLYKDIIDKYSYILDPLETVYDYYTEDEIYLMQRAIETECYDQNFESKANVAAVILNRIDSCDFGETVKEVITEPNQFAYWRKNITKDTILALEYSFQIEDTTNGCIAFRSDINAPKKWNGWRYAFSDLSGHNFYRQRGE